MKVILIFAITIVLSWKYTRAMFMESPSAASNIAKIDQSFQRKGYVYAEEVGAFYKVHTKKKTWSEALEQCIKEGARLVVPETQEEYVTLVKMMKEHNISDIYLGIHDQFVEGEFNTIDGIPISLIHHQWGENEPNDFANREDCVSMNMNENLSDVDCITSENFACKKIKISANNHYCHTSEKGYFPVKDLDRCYKLHISPKPWLEAYKVCQAEGSYLAVLNSRKEAKALVGALFDHDTSDVLAKYVAVGFHALFSDNFYTIHGDSLEEAGYNV